MSQAIHHLDAAERHERAGLLREAETFYREAIRLDPQLAAAHHNFALLLQSQQRWNEAIAILQTAIASCPRQAELHVNMGNALYTIGRFGDAAPCYAHAIALGNLERIDDAHFRLALCLHALGHCREAIVEFERALAIRPNNVDYLYWMGQSQLQLGQLDAARACAERAIAIQPDHAASHVVLATILLTQGEFPQGFREFEHRFRLDAADRASRGPRWDGSALGDRTLVVGCERGFGDTMQLIRYVPPIEASGGRVIVEVRRELIPLLQASGFKNLVADGDLLPAFDVQLPLMSLPGVLGTTLDSIPAAIPYLHIGADYSARWRERLAAAIDGRAFTVGIHWQGNATYAGDRQRSIAPSHFAALARVPGIRLVSLQKNVPGEKQRELIDKAGLVVFDDLDQNSAFLDTAAIVRNLDLVITSDSAVAHLAGAMGARVWLALSALCDWRWLLDRGDSPWYPTMRLFRQTTLGDWPGVFEQIAAELSRAVHERPS